MLDIRVFADVTGKQVIGSSNIEMRLWCLRDLRLSWYEMRHHTGCDDRAY